MRHGNAPERLARHVQGSEPLHFIGGDVHLREHVGGVCNPVAVRVEGCDAARDGEDFDDAAVSDGIQAARSRS